jgi:hypothetical protein
MVFKTRSLFLKNAKKINPEVKNLIEGLKTTCKPLAHKEKPVRQLQRLAVTRLSSYEPQTSSGSLIFWGLSPFFLLP